MSLINVNDPKVQDALDVLLQSVLETLTEQLDAVYNVPLRDAGGTEDGIDAIPTPADDVYVNAEVAGVSVEKAPEEGDPKVFRPGPGKVKAAETKTPVVEPGEVEENPLILLDHVKKDGMHPFFQGSVSYLIYLPPIDRVKYLRGLDDGNSDEYPDRASFVDMDQLPAMMEDGIDRTFIQQFLDNFVVGSAEPKHDMKVYNMFFKDPKGKAQLQGTAAKIPNGERLFQFLGRIGISKTTIKDFQKIVSGYMSSPNPYHTGA